MSQHTVEPDLELAGQVARQLVRLVKTMERGKVQAAAARGDNMERACFALLVELADRGPRRTTALAEAVLADTSTVSRQVGQLVQLGYVERQPDPGDGRASQLAATDLGMRHVREGRARRNEMFARLLSGWSVADRRRLVELLERLNDDFDHYRQENA